MSRPFAPRTPHFDSTVSDTDQKIEVAKVAALESIAQSLEYFRRIHEEEQAKERNSR